MFSGAQIADVLAEVGVTHVVLLPDSTLGPWENDLRAAPGIEVVRVCREGEAWGVAAGLFLGGARPIVMIQCTGLFESGDALRNVLFDYQLPLFALVGYRSYSNQETLPGDTARIYTEPLLEAWGIDYRLIDAPRKITLLSEHYLECRDQERPGVILMAEGRA